MKRPKTGGRQKGTPNKTTAGLKALAGKHGKEAISALLVLAREGDNENIRLAAWKELLDRGYGKPAQSVEIGVAVEVTKIERIIVDPLLIEGEAEHDDNDES